MDAPGFRSEAFTYPSIVPMSRLLRCASATSRELFEWERYRRRAPHVTNRRQARDFLFGRLFRAHTQLINYTHEEQPWRQASQLPANRATALQLESAVTMIQDTAPFTAGESRWIEATLITARDSGRIDERVAFVRDTGGGVLIESYEQWLDDEYNPGVPRVVDGLLSAREVARVAISRVVSLSAAHSRAVLDHVRDPAT